MTRKSWIQVDGKLIPKEEYNGNNVRADYHIQPDIEPFTSPITGEVIMGRSHLRRHMKQHGVTNSADYSPEFYERKQTERKRKQERDGKRHRIELIKRQLER
jgi:hypothetical protein